PARYARMITRVRYTLFAVYQRVFSAIFIANFIALLVLLRNNTDTVKLDTLATCASSNLLASVLVRQDHFINLLFSIVWLVPWSVPVGIRRSLARVYTYGGLHTGTAVSGTMWWLVFTALLTLRHNEVDARDSLVLATTWAVLMLLALVCILALPAMRTRYHNTFELSHRLLGWTCVLLFWTQLLIITWNTSRTIGSSFSQLLIRQPSFWNLTLLTLLLTYPWLHLRKHTFHPELLSSHAVRLHLTHKVPRFSCLSISSSPLREWHPFATFPSTSPTHPNASLIISSAGDWTRNVIHTVGLSALTHSPPKSLTFYTKGHPHTHLLSLTPLFPRVLLVTTGSGIGPCLSSLLSQPRNQFMRLIWSTRSPEKTYGKEIVDLVRRLEPGAVILDTDVEGRGDLCGLAWRIYREVEAEAVFVLSNRRQTRTLVRGLGEKGVGVFAPVWDS
ncbi:hypothetical protein M011DRAFT_374092, partial [Sporormia fimetaria CBS 119925]